MVNHYQKLGKNQITFREGQMIYVSEPGLYSLINGSQNFENKKEFIQQLEKWIVDLNTVGIVD